MSPRTTALLVLLIGVLLLGFSSTPLATGIASAFALIVAVGLVVFGCTLVIFT